MSHSAWNEAKRSKRLVIACADKLWKGKELTDLEDLLEAGQRRASAGILGGVQPLGTRFEEIAGGGDEGLERSRSPV